MVFMTSGAKAAETESQFIENLCVTKVENQFTVQFDAKKEISLTKSDEIGSRIDIDVYDNQNDNHLIYGRTCNDGICDTTVTKVIAKSNTCSIQEAEGTLVDGQKIAKGATVASYNTIIYNKESFANAENLMIEISIYDDNADWERIVYSVKEQKIVAIYNGHDITPALYNRIVEKYGEDTFGFGGSETSLYLSYNVKLSEAEYAYTTIEITDLDKKTEADIDKIMADIEAAVSGKSLKSELYEEHYTIDKETFNNIKNNGYKIDYEYRIYDEEAKQEYVGYAWTFDGSQMASSNYDLNLQLTVGSSKNQETIESLVADKEKALVLEFAHHGELPKGTSVKVYVGNKYKNGDYVTLYYYNEETKTLEEAVANIEVKDGYVEFGLEHCSEYVLNISAKPEVVETQEVNKAPNNAQTSSMNVIFYGGLSIVSLLGLTYLLVSKKKQA